MKFISTRNATESLSLDAAIMRGLAADGGLYVPSEFPHFDLKKIEFINWIQFAQSVLTPFFKDSHLLLSLARHCEHTFTFPLPVVPLNDQTHVLELFHGPTSAFKDVGARFLSSVTSELFKNSKKPKLVLVATSGDTGGAVAAAFSGRADIRVAILYPKGKISARQEKQLTCWDKNIKAFAINGTFDDCQKLVKDAFVSQSWQNKWNLISANSISLARLLPQMVYFAGVSLQRYQLTKQTTNFIVPTGNLGNSVAAVWARQCGFPIDKIAFALNANSVIYDYLQTGHWQPSKTLPTLANAMDVGAPSNFERLKNLFPTVENTREFCSAITTSDEEIKNTIRSVYKENNYIICPHTATAFYAKKILAWNDAVIVATAHPAKFEDIVEPIINKNVPIPEALASLLNLPSQKVELDPRLESLATALQADF